MKIIKVVENPPDIKDKTLAEKLEALLKLSEQEAAEEKRKEERKKALLRGELWWEKY